MPEGNNLCVRNGGPWECGERIEHTLPGAQNVCLRALRNRLEMAKEEGSKAAYWPGPNRDVREASAHIDLALADVPIKESQLHLDAARNLLGPAITRRSASQNIIQRAKLLYVHLDAFPYARSGEPMPDHLKLITRQEVRQMFLSNNQVPVHKDRRFEPNHWIEDHTPCFGDEESKARESLMLAFYQLCHASEVDIYPSTVRESHMPPGLARFRSDALLVHEGKKVPVKILGKERPSDKTSRSLPFILRDIFVAAAKTADTSIRGSGTLLQRCTDLVRRQAEGKYLTTNERELLQNVGDEIKGKVAAYNV